MNNSGVLTIVFPPDCEEEILAVMNQLIERTVENILFTHDGDQYCGGPVLGRAPFTSIEEAFAAWNMKCVSVHSGTNIFAYSFGMADHRSTSWLLCNLVKISIHGTLLFIHTDGTKERYTLHKKVLYQRGQMQWGDDTWLDRDTIMQMYDRNSDK